MTWEDLPEPVREAIISYGYAFNMLQKARWSRQYHAADKIAQGVQDVDDARQTLAEVLGDYYDPASRNPVHLRERGKVLLREIHETDHGRVTDYEVPNRSDEAPDGGWGQVFVLGEGFDPSL